MSNRNSSEKPGSSHTKSVLMKAVVPHDLRPGRHDLDDRARLAEQAKGALQGIRKTAENWRTGMAGMTALVTASLLFKGKDSITAYEVWVQYTLAALVLVSLVLSVISLWLFLRSAHGRLETRSAQSILDIGLDVHNVQLTEAALQDLLKARTFGLFAAGTLAVALLMSWFGPGAKAPEAFVRVVVADQADKSRQLSLCGQLQGLDGNTTLMLVTGEPQSRRIETPRLVSLSIVSDCK